MASPISVINQAARRFSVKAPVLWAIYGAESSWGKAPASFGLTGDYPGRGTSGDFRKDANRSAQILQRLLGETGSYEAALRKYSGGSYGMGHVDALLKTKPYPGSTPSYTPSASLVSASALPVANAASGLAQTLQRPQGSVSAPAAPAFSARVQQPAGYTAPPGAPPAVQTPDLRQQLSQILQADAPPAYQPSAVPTPVGQVDPHPSAGGLPEANPSYKLRDLFSRAAKIDAEHLPYKWGGGHGPTPAKPGVPLDCSGAVSRLFGVSPRVSGQYETFGDPGRGKNVTIYANGHHVLVEIAGRFWGTSATNPGGGAGWIPRSAISQSYLKNFTARHPTGM